MLTKTKKTIVIGELTSRVTLIGSYSKNLNLLCLLRIPQKAKPYKWAYIVRHARKLSPKDREAEFYMVIRRQTFIASRNASLVKPKEYVRLYVLLQKLLHEGGTSVGSGVLIRRR